MTSLATKSVQNYKLRLLSVIENLEKLEQASKHELNLPNAEIEALTKQTNKILKSLEQQPPPQKLKKMLEKRKRKRQKAKLKRKMKINNYNESTSILLITQKINVPTESLKKSQQAAVTPTPTTSSQSLQKPHQQLRSYRDANRFLKTFELLELLHAARSQDEPSTREFANKLSKLRKIWNVIRFENKPDRNASLNVENQWDIVFFGAHEKSFFKQKRSVNDLIAIRRKWDSYITSDAKIGTNIPNCWVLPRVEADERWQRYRVE